LRESEKTRFKSQGIDSDSDHDSLAEKSKNKSANKSAQSTIIHSKIVLEIPDDSFPQIRSGIESDYLLRRPEESELHKHDFSGIGPALKGGGCITANAMLLQQRREEESQSVR
jgi:hypothetical protein